MLPNCFERRKPAALLTMFWMILLTATYPAFGQWGQSCTILATPRPMPNGTSLPLAVTPDGRYTLFSSAANNLVPGDTNSQTDLFLYDMLKDEYSRVSVGTGGTQGIGGAAQQGKMDAEARYICFSSRAVNLVPGDTNGREDVFLRDRQTGNTLCLSVRAGTVVPNGGVNPTMSLGGRYAGLSLNRTSPVGRPYSAYVYDIIEQTYILVSKDNAGNPADGESYMRDISENGRFVLFASNATSLDPRATDGRFYLYLHDRDSDDDGVFDSGETRTMLASLESDGDPEASSLIGWSAEELAQGMLGGNWRVLFSPEGSLLHLYDVMRNETVMMETAWNPDFSGLTSITDDARQLVYPKMMPGGHVQLLWRDMETGETRIASVTSVGQEANVVMTGNAGLGQRLLSHAGQCVTFGALDSVDVAWVPSDFNGVSDVVRRHFRHNTTTGISVTIGKRPNSAASSPSVSYDGSIIAFISDASDLVAGDLNEKADVFIKMGGFTFRIMANGGAEPNGHSEAPAVSADGRFVAFVSEATNMIANDGNNFKDVFLYEVANNSLMRVSNGMGGSTPNEESVQPSVSRNGEYVVFTSVAGNLVPNDTNGASDVFLYNRLTGTLIRIEGAAGQPNGSSADAAISADGRYVAFVSEASNLVLGDTNNRDDVFVYEVATGQMTIVRAHNGALANRNAFTLDINEDGRYVAFCSNSTNLVPNDTNDRRDIFVWDRLSGQMELVSVDSYGRQGNRDSIDPSISADGRHVAFLSESSNFMPGDKDIDYGPLGGEGSVTYDVDVFVADRERGWLYYGVSSANGSPANRPSQSPKISGDGQSVVFVTHASNLECSRAEPRDMGDILLHAGSRCLPPGDVDGDGHVDDRDLLAVLFDFGSEDSPADVVVDGMVDDADLLAVLFNYGTDCSAAARGDRNDREDQQLYFSSLQQPGRESSDNKSDENEGDVYVIRTAEPFDEADWNRQVRELDMAHAGKWPYPVAGYGSEPWVSLYGDPLLWKDNGSQFGNDLLGGSFGGDFTPQIASYSYSNSKTVSLGNSNVNVYMMGKLYIYATCYYGGYFKAEAQGEAGVNLFGLSAKFAEAYGLAEAANNSFKLNAYLKVVGQTLWSTTLNQGLSYTKQGTIGPWAKNMSKSWTLWLGIVPIKVTVGFNASIGAHYYFFAGLFPVKAHARFQPFVSSSAYIQAGLAWSLVCSASAGVGGSLTLLNDTLTAEALGHLFVFDENCCAQVTLRIHNQMNALSGSFYLYANACCWGLNGSKCGYGRRSQSWQHTLTSWPGYSASGNLFFAQYTYCF